MIALWTEIYVRTETAYRARIEEAKTGGYGYSGENVFEAKDSVIALHDLRSRFNLPEGMEVTLVYAAWYQTTLFHDNITKFVTLDVKTTGYLGTAAGSGVTLEAQSVAGEDGQINLRVHMLCEVQQKQQ